MWSRTSKPSEEDVIRPTIVSEFTQLKDTAGQINANDRVSSRQVNPSADAEYELWGEADYLSLTDSIIL